MNLVAVAPWWLTAALCALLVAAAVQDLVRLKISNVITVGVAFAAILAASINGWSLDFWQNLVVFMGLLAGGTLLFASGNVGGGDVKLLAAAGLWVDFQRALILLPAVFVAGGVLAIVVLSPRMLLRPASAAGPAPRSKGVPYGVAIAIGMLTLVAFHAQSHLGRYRELTGLNHVPADPKA